METTIKELINSTIKPLMKDAGFKKKALTFQKTTDDLIFIVNLQKSHGNSHSELGFFINCGVYSKEIDLTLDNEVNEAPKEYQCHYRARIENISDKAESIFKITPSTNLEKLSDRIYASLNDVLTFYNGIDHHEEFISSISDKGHFNATDIFRYCLRKKQTELAQNIIRNKKEVIGDSRWDEQFVPRFLEIIEEEKADFSCPELTTEQRTELPSDKLETFNHYFDKALDWGINDGDYPFAIDYFRNYCLSILPEPKTSFKESTKLYTKLGEAYLLNQEYQKATEALEIAKTCPSPDENEINSLLERCAK